MKILMVTRESQADKRYGLNKSLAPVIVELERRGIEVGYLCQADAGERGLATLRSWHGLLVKLFGRFFTHTEFVPLLWGILERLNMGRLAVKVMAREQYSHVHCHDPIIGAGYRWFARVRWFARLRRGHTARWGVTEHGFGCYAEAFHIDGAQLGTGVMRWLRRWEAKVLLKAHWVMTPTQSGLAQLGRDLSVYPIPSSWHAIYHPRPVLNVYSKTEARQRLGWAAEDIYLIAVGRFAPLKQFPALIRASAGLPLHGWKLVLIGEGDRAPLEALATELKILENLSFAVTDDVGLYYSAADIYVSTSVTESFGLANLEALVMGLPAVCTAVGGVPEVMGNGAYLIPAQDRVALVRALQVLLDDVDSRQAWGERAWQRSRLWPPVDEVAEAYIRMYQGVPQSGVSERTAIEGNKAISFPWKDWQRQVNQWQICPLPQVLELPQQARVLMIAPHPDDETLGCGGTLALLRQQGCQVKVVIVTDGKQGDPLGYSAEDVVSRRRRESLAALNLLGIHDVMFLTEPDSHYQHTSRVASQLAAILTHFAADWLLLPSVLDYHRDHVAISLSMLEVWQQQGCRERVFLYETWAPIPATWIVDISTVFALKQQAIQCYQLPLKYCDYSMAGLGMGSYRGLYLSEKQSKPSAEAFMELRVDSWRPVLRHFWQIRKYQEDCLTTGR